MKTRHIVMLFNTTNVCLSDSTGDIILQVQLNTQNYDSFNMTYDILIPKLVFNTTGNKQREQKSLQSKLN